MNNHENTHRGLQKKTIRKVLCAKIEEWAKSIADLDVRKEFYDNVIITGGCIPSMLLGETVNDFDAYMRTFDSTVKMAEHYVKQFNELNQPLVVPYVKTQRMTNIKNEEEERVCIFVQSEGTIKSNDEEFPEDELYENSRSSNDIFKGIHGDKVKDGSEEENALPPYRPMFMSQNAITLKGKVQLVIRFHGEPTQIHSNYDFQHAMCSYDYANDELVLPSEALECLLSKVLIYRGSLYPICSLFRIRKFVERGWKISAGEILKIAWQISKIDLNDLNTLREQLIGCDAMYFHHLIKLLETEKDNNGFIDSTRVIQVIDEVFGQ